MAVVPFIVSITCFGQAVLRQKKRFEITAMHSLTISVIGIVSVVIFGRRNTQNADSLAIAFVVSALIFCVLVRVTMNQYGRVRLHRPVINDNIRTVFKMIIPLMISYGISRISLMVDRIIASTIGEGTVSSLTYAHSLYNAVTGVFVVNLCTILLTDFNNLFAQKQAAELKRKIENAVSTITLVLLPITIIAMVCSTDVVRIIYQRGHFNSSNTAEVAALLFIYVIDFIPGMVLNVNNQALYAAGDTKAAMNRSFINIFTNIGMSVLLSRFLGILGVAIGTVISCVISAVLSSLSVRKHIKGYHVFIHKKYLLKVTLAGIACFICVYTVKNILHKGALITFVLSSILGLFSFFFVLVLEKESITVSYLKQIKGRLKRLRG